MSVRIDFEDAQSNGKLDDLLQRDCHLILNVWPCEVKDELYRAYLPNAIVVECAPHMDVADIYSSVLSDISSDFQQLPGLQSFADVVRRYNKRVLVEDVGCLDYAVQKKLARDMQTLWRYGCYLVVIHKSAGTNGLSDMHRVLGKKVKEIELYS